MTPTDPASALAHRYWEGLLELEPLIGTMVGDERFDDRLSDPSESGLERRHAFQQGALDELARIDRGDLDVTMRTTLDVLESIARREVAEIAHRFDRLQVVSHLWGPGQLLAELGSMQRADTPERLDRYVTRLSAIPAYLGAVDEVLRDAVASGTLAPRVVAERAVGQVERLLAIDPAESPALAALEKGDADGRGRVMTVVRDVVNPAYEGYLDGLRTYLPHATETIGLSALPDGDAMYATQILAWTTLPLEAAEIHEIGVERLGSIQEERREIAASLGFSSAAEAVAAHTDAGRNTAASREDLLQVAREQVQRGWEAAPAFFGRMPSDNCDVRLVEEFREADMPFAFYQPPTADGSRPGVYYVNAYDLPTRPLHHLASTSYHEANPGHHFQLTIEQQIPDRPALRSFGGMLAGSAFVEGWGLYSERLADEMGLFADEYERLGMLDAQAHRAARLVTDTGIHALGWPRADSIQALEDAGVPATDAVIEIDRYIAMPAQALSYMVGMIEVERARDAAAAKEGAEFSLKAFHDRILGLGSLPLPSLLRELG
ncbi:MAG: DUF885 domain-containing protein [Actinomycetota bacterium]